jgi:hypothetical protein
VVEVPVQVTVLVVASAASASRTRLGPVVAFRNPGQEVSSLLYGTSYYVAALSSSKPLTQGSVPPALVCTRATSSKSSSSTEGQVGPFKLPCTPRLCTRKGALPGQAYGVCVCAVNSGGGGGG